MTAAVTRPAATDWSLRVGRDSVPPMLVKRILILLALVGFGLAGLACERTAELIPGEPTDTPTATPEVSTTVTATPVATESLGTGGQSPRVPVPDETIVKAIVQIRVVTDDRRDSPLRDGSGVSIDIANRLVLTSYSLVMPIAADGTRIYDRILVAPNRIPGEDPVVEFEAEILTADPALDLAVLRVVRDAAGEELRGGEFDIEAVDIVDEDAALRVGDTMRLYGHPGLQHPDWDTQTVTITAAPVTGFRGEAGYTGNRWIKTTALLPYGTQGGGAFDSSGRLAGIIVQSVFDPAVPVGLIRPVELGREAIAAAERLGPEARYTAPLTVRGGLGTHPAATGSIWVERPSFAESALERDGGIDLVDYGAAFPSGVMTLHYEFEVQGVPDGALIDEKWYRDGILQDQLSLSYEWRRGPFALVTDSIGSPNPAGFPDGTWRLEIWVDDELQAGASAYIGQEGDEPTLSASEPAFGALATDSGTASAPLASGADQMLFFFDFAGMELVHDIRWLVFHDGNVIYTSPTLHWSGGERGSWWLGYRDLQPIRPGTWEVEIHLDGEIAMSRSVTLP